jgi:hypothetical protein
LQITSSSAAAAAALFSLFKKNLRSFSLKISVKKRKD